MFIGHAALGFAAKARLPRASLAAFLTATFALDLLWPVFLLIGIEQVRIEPGNTAFTPLAFVAYPWSHSLVMAVVWGTVLGIGVFAWRRNVVEAAVAEFLVISHWLLDFVAHRPDLPLWPAAGAPRLGLGLWNSVPATLAIEGIMFAAALGLYLRATRARDRAGVIGLFALIGFLVFAWASGPFLPPPPSERAIAVTGAIFGFLMVPWIAWIDRHRPPAP
jgi:hypothetical protein